MRFLLLIVLHVAASAGAFAATVEIVPGVDDTGRATALWREMIRKRLPAADFRAIEHLEKPLTAGEAAWAALIHSRAAPWEKEAPALAQVFRPLAPPAARIVLGNRGGEDAFTHDPHTIGFDLERLQAIYGDAAKPENTARIDRFFRHEYTHLLQKAWLQQHPYAADTPLDAALLGTWLEGMGNWYSMSDGWRATDGRESGKARETLAILVPRFVARLAALACATESDAKRLMADHSMGRFDRKWGALTAALWIEQEASVSDNALRNFVLAGPEGVWALAKRHVEPSLSPVLEEIRAAEVLCRGKRSDGQD
ncbi:MAG TPA: hypothetical protein VF254_00770 [Gammaproteobacteria bacterium]